LAYLQDCRLSPERLILPDLTVLMTAPVDLADYRSRPVNDAIQPRLMTSVHDRTINESFAERIEERGIQPDRFTTVGVDVEDDGADLKRALQREICLR
jgi:hypothetical protein